MGCSLGTLVAAYGKRMDEIMCVLGIFYTFAKQTVSWYEVTKGTGGHGRLVGVYDFYP